MAEEIDKELLKTLAEILNKISVPIKELKVLDNSFLPDNVIVVPTKIFNELKKLYGQKTT